MEQQLHLHAAIEEQGNRRRALGDAALPSTRCSTGRPPTTSRCKPRSPGTAKQKPKKYDYHGDRVTGSANDQLSPYAIAGLGGTYRLSKNLSLGAGVDNLFDKRLFRAGNAQGVVGIDGAGAATYEPGRTFYTSLTASF